MLYDVYLVYSTRYMLFPEQTFSLSTKNIFRSIVEQIIWHATHQGYAYGHRQEEDVRAAVFQDLKKRK